MKIVGLLVASLIGMTVAIQVRLSRREPTTYIAPTYDANGVGRDFSYNSGLTEQVAVDQRRGLVYTVGQDQITVLKLTSAGTLRVLHAEKFPMNIFKMVQVCKGHVTVTARDTNNQKNGRILVFEPYRRNSKTLAGQLIHSIPVGPRPKHHVHDRTCRRIIVALEGRDETNAGAIAIVTFRKSWRRSLFQEPHVRTLTFSHFAGQVPNLEDEWFLVNPDSLSLLFEEAVEPEWICINKKGTQAYVTLQENNGLAVIDLTKGKERIKSVRGLGLKDWSDRGTTGGFDGGNDPPAISIMNANVFSAYMPDAISCETIKRKDCLIFANEGEFFQNTRIKVQDAGFVDGIDLDEALADLYVLGSSTIADRNKDGDLETAVITGARSFSIRCGGLPVLADTGSDLERRIAGINTTFPLFNANPDGGEAIDESYDSQSISKGPAPESLKTFRACKGRYIVMIGGSENPGTISVYTLDTRNIAAGFQFQDIEHGYQNLDSDLTDEELYEERLLTLRDPEGLSIISGTRYGGGPILVVASRITSSLDLFDIAINCRDENIPPPIDLPPSITDPEVDPFMGVNP